MDKSCGKLHRMSQGDGLILRNFLLRELDNGERVVANCRRLGVATESKKTDMARCGILGLRRYTVNEIDPKSYASNIRYGTLKSVRENHRPEITTQSPALLLQIISSAIHATKVNPPAEQRKIRLTLYLELYSL